MKSDLQPSTHVQPLGMLIDTSLEKVFLLEASLADFWGAATSFLLIPSPCSSSCWATRLRWSVFSLEVAHGCICCSGNSRTTGPSQWTTLPFRSLCCQSAWRHMLLAPGGQMGVRCPSPGFSSIPVAAYRLVFVGLGSPPVRSDGFGVWSQEESSLHISVLEMKAVVLALAAFLLQLSS